LSVENVSPLLLGVLLQCSRMILAISPTGSQARQLAVENVEVDNKRGGGIRVGKR
jgi:hypothetical protein